MPRMVTLVLLAILPVPLQAQGSDLLQRLKRSARFEDVHIAVDRRKGHARVAQAEAHEAAVDSALRIPT